MREINTKHLALASLCAVAAVLTYEYVRQIDWPFIDTRLELHTQIIAGDAPAPYRYRVLVPFLTEAARQILTPLLSSRGAFILVYTAYDFATFFSLLFLLYLYLKIWFTAEQALIASLLAAGTMPIALQDHAFQPWSLLEAALMSLGLLLIYRRRYQLLALVIALAALNRETGLFIVLAFLFARVEIGDLLKRRAPISGKPIILFLSYLTLWAGIFLGLRLVRGDAPQVITVPELIARNTTAFGIFSTILNVSLFLGPFWIMTLLGFRYAPLFARRVALVIPLYLVTVIIWGVWYEVRLLMPLYPAIFPLGLAFIYPPKV